jgi:hypothetical protein
MASQHDDLFQAPENISRHAFRNLNSTDVLGIKSGFIGNRSDDIAWLDSVFMTDFNTKRFHSGF